MRLWLDPAKLAAFQLSPVDVRNALNRENVEFLLAELKEMILNYQ